jgi:hypothetical protein
METNTPVVKKPFYKKKWVWAVAIIVLIIIGSGDSTSKPQAVNTDNTTETIPVSTNNDTPEAATPVQTQTFEDRIKALAVKTGATDVNFNGIDDQKADSDRPEGSRMITVKLNVTNFFSSKSFYRDTGELTSKIFQETYASNPSVYDVIVWYYGETTDQYGNKKNDIILSQATDKDTYQKINWQNFDSTKLCDFLKSEGFRNGGQTTCVTLANIE